MALFGRDYDREFGYGSRPRGDMTYGNRPTRYDRNFGYRGTGYGATTDYDLDYGYKSRWQTDYGDPYGDRASHTPIRMIRGEFRGDYGADFNTGFDRSPRGEYDRFSRYGGTPMSYDPYQNQGRGEYQGRPDAWGRGGRWNPDIERGGRWNQEMDRGNRWNQGRDRGGRFGAGGARGYQGYTENRYDTGWF